MKKQVDFVNKSSNILFIKLTPETDAEQDLLKRNDDEDTIRLYYDMAIMEKLGKDYSFLRVVDQSQWPYAAQVLVQYTKGFGE